MAQADTPLPRKVSSDWQAQIFGRGAGGDDQRIAGVLAVVAEQAKGALPQIDPIDVVEHDVGVESFGVAAHAFHERRALQVFDIARPVVHIGGGHELAALLQAGDQREDAGWPAPHTRPRNNLQDPTPG